MESYQSIGVMMGIAGIVLALALVAHPVGVLALLIIPVSFIGIILALLNTKHHRNVGVALIILGVIGNILLILPGIMAYRYKPQAIPR
jgi:hypothetical protein